MMNYYVWYDGGCGPKTNDLEDARRIEKELLEDGFENVFITTHQ